MIIHLPKDLERFVRDQVLSGQFASEDDALTEAVRLLRERCQSQPSSDVVAGPSDRTRRQADNLQRLCRKLDSMPVALVSDGLTNRDHDRILYGRRP